MNTHLQECIYTPENIDHDKGIRWGGSPCICDRLRACEQRMYDWSKSFGVGKTFYDAGRAAGIDAAEAAVAEVLDRTPNAMNGEYITVSKHFPADLIAAIDALKEKE